MLRFGYFPLISWSSGCNSRWRIDSAKYGYVREFPNDGVQSVRLLDGTMNRSETFSVVFVRSCRSQGRKGSVMTYFSFANSGVVEIKTIWIFAVLDYFVSTGVYFGSLTIRISRFYFCLITIRWKKCYQRISEKFYYIGKV